MAKASTDRDSTYSPLVELSLGSSLDENTSLITSLFENVELLRERHFENAAAPHIRFCVYFCEGLVNSDLISRHIIEPLILSKTLDNTKDLLHDIKSRVLTAGEVKCCAAVDVIVEAITYGDTVLFVGDSRQALVISSKNFALRSISEPEGERVLSGPREGFTEGIIFNLSMVRRRLRTHELKFEFLRLGIHSKTSLCIVYMDNIVNKNILKELRRRLHDIQLDAILDANYVAEYIAEKSTMGFATAGTTERPDVVVGKLMEGRIALFVDGSPVVLTLPYLFIENFQSSEDYYLDPIYTSFARILRILCFILTVTVSGLYIAVVAYQHEILPPALMVNFTSERTGVPLPAAPECFVMLLLFDILRETGVRMPNHVGQTMSVVGALVIGQAAVAANLVAAPMVIIVAFTGITILLVPRLTTASLIGRYLCLTLASLLGFVGLMISMAVILIHILNLQSFGVPSLLYPPALRFQEVKDLFIRAPWPKMLTRTLPVSYNVVRQEEQHKNLSKSGRKA